MKVAPIVSICAVCRLPPDARQKVNEAIWPDGHNRSRFYRADAVTLLKVMLGRPTNPKLVTRHADHVEGSWREDEPGEKPKDEKPVFATDFASVVEAAASLGMRAMESLGRDLDGGFIDPRDKVGIAKMGVVAVGQKEASRLKGREQSITVQALFGLVSGFLEEPENEVKNVTPLDDLLAPILEKRRQLHLAAGHD